MINHRNAHRKTIAICCGLTENGSVSLDPTLEEQKMQAFAYLAFPNSPLSVIPKSSYSGEAEPIKHRIIISKSSCSGEAEPIDHGIVTSVTRGAMSGGDYFNRLERGRAACARMPEILRRSFQSQVLEDSSKAT